MLSLGCFCSDWLFAKQTMTIEEIAETITVDFFKKCPVFDRDKWYADPWDVLVRCSSLVSESEGNPVFHPLNSEYRNH